MSSVKTGTTKGMILAAGLGTRLRPVTDRYAKPAVPFLNVPLLYYSVALLEAAGVNELVVNTHHKPEQIERLAHAIPGFRGQVSISHEPGEPLGSGGGIWKARTFLAPRPGDRSSGRRAGDDFDTGDFFLANGDEVILPKDPDIMKRLREEHEREGALATILVMRHPLVGTQFGGVWADATGVVRGFGKDGAKFGSGVTGYHYIGLQLLSDRVFEYLPEGQSNILYDALATGIARGETVRVVVSDFAWYETGNPHDFLRATGACLELLTGASAASPEAVFLRGVLTRYSPDSRLLTAPGSLLLTSGNATIGDGVKLTGFIVVGDGAQVATGARIENVVVLPSAVASSEAALHDQIVF